MFNEHLVNCHKRADSKFSHSGQTYCISFCEFQNAGSAKQADKRQLRQAKLTNFPVPQTPVADSRGRSVPRLMQGFIEIVYNVNL